MRRRAEIEEQELQVPIRCLALHEFFFYHTSSVSKCLSKKNRVFLTDMLFGRLTLSDFPSDRGVHGIDEAQSRMGGSVLFFFFACSANGTWNLGVISD